MTAISRLPTCKRAKTHFVNNGDGTYTTRSVGLPTRRRAFRTNGAPCDNAGTIRQDEAQFEQNVREDRQRNQERSDESRQLEEDCSVNNRSGPAGRRTSV